MSDRRKFEKWFLSWVRPITEDLHILEGTNEMFLGKEREPLQAATDLAFRTMAEFYLDRDSLSSGQWWLSQLRTKALAWTDESYKYVSGSTSMEFGSVNGSLTGGPLSLPMEIYRLFQTEWPSIVNEAQRIYEVMRSDCSEKDLRTLEENLRYLLRGSCEDINRNVRSILSIYTQNLDVSVIDAISCEKYEGSSTQCQFAIISDTAELIPFDEKSRLSFVMDNPCPA